MGKMMQFFSKLLNFSAKIKKLEEQASDSFELPNNSKALRVSGTIYIIDTQKNKIAQEFKDIFPINPARATFQIMKKMGLETSYTDYSNSVHKKESKKEIWTCGFRDNEERWMWYCNSEPRLTVSFKEANPNIAEEEYPEKKIEFCSAKYGTSIIAKITEQGVEKTSKELNALVLEKPYTKIKCEKCSKVDNYTIDDIVDEKKKANYDSNFVVCGSCDDLIRLI